MEGKTKERWVQLCEQAAKEQDSGRLAELIKEIDRPLTEKAKRLENTPTNRNQNSR